MIRPIKKRYIAFKVVSKVHPFENEVLAAINQTLLKDNLGSEMKKMRVQMIEYDLETGLGIFRCGHKSVETIRSSIEAVTKPTMIKLIGVSGTIKALRQKFLS